MEPPTPPKITGIDIEAAKPNEADSEKIARISADTNRSLPQVAQVVRVRLSAKPPATSMAWRLYVDDVLIPKYWEYEDGIYFTVLDPQFFSDHTGEPLRFSQDGVDFFETGVKLPAPTEAVADLGLRRQAAKPSKRKATKASKKKATKTSKSKKR
ncbi:MAG TPA: hypothetical protein VJR02_30055 [Pyrinomonadaceae bacterium]|nr:hypothetical protein [Pyrinomonadaceae bacterium]